MKKCEAEIVWIRVANTHYIRFWRTAHTNHTFAENRNSIKYFLGDLFIHELAKWKRNISLCRKKRDISCWNISREPLSEVIQPTFSHISHHWSTDYKWNARHWVFFLLFFPHARQSINSGRKEMNFSCRHRRMTSKNEQLQLRATLFNSPASYTIYYVIFLYVKRICTNTTSSGWLCSFQPFKFIEIKHSIMGILYVSKIHIILYTEMLIPT